MNDWQREFYKKFGHLEGDYTQWDKHEYRAIRAFIQSEVDNREAEVRSMCVTWSFSDKDHPVFMFWVGNTVVKTVVGKPGEEGSFCLAQLSNNGGISPVITPEEVANFRDNYNESEGRDR